MLGSRRVAPIASLTYLAFISLVALVAIATSAPGCAVDDRPTGVRRSQKTGGPSVVFDLTRKPLPEIPLPNDVATWPDATSRTGRRINASVLAPTSIERVAREKFAQLEGFGTFAPISIPFDKPLDTDDVKKRHVGDDYELTDDAVYVVNLKTGVPVPLDLGAGNFPLTLRDVERYWPNDPAKGEANLLYETREEDANGNGVLDPGEDTDFDGVLDHPNFPGRVRPPNGVDGLMTFYESETNTLVLRPMIPLDEMTEYAVVVTDRLKGVDGKIVQSPFDWVHHPAQRMAVERLADRMVARPQYYGFSGGPLDHVQFAFTFTTQPTATDLFAMRDGIYGQGKLAWIAQEFPPQIKLLKATGVEYGDEPDRPGWETKSETCQQQGPKTRYIAKYTDGMRQTVRGAASELFGIKGPGAKRLVDGFDSIAYFAIATVRVPWLLGDVKDVSPSTSISYDPATGAIPHSADDVPFFLVVPKTTATHKPPFPVAFYGHGYTGNGTEGLLFAGEMARHGIATIGLNAPGHGLEMSETEVDLARSLFGSGCLTPFGTWFSKNRIRDLSREGERSGNSGADFWTAYLFHTRDMVRQAIVEQMLVTRALRMFDGKTRYDWSGDGNADKLAGDFDGDGVVDIAGPTAPIFAWGESLGGVLSQIHGGVDPAVTATAPVSGGGALTDVGIRSFQGGVVEAVDLRIMGPLVVSVPADTRLDYKRNGAGDIIRDDKGNPILADKADQTRTACAKGERSLRWVYVLLNRTVETEIACAKESELTAGLDVVVANDKSGERRCARVTASKSDDGAPQLRVAIPASVGDPIDIAFWRPPPGSVQAVETYGKSCLVRGGATLVRDIRTWQGLPRTCSKEKRAKNACGNGPEVEVGARLFAPAEGYGLRRQSPDFRRFMQLAQIALEPADPVTFAPYYFVKPRLDPYGKPAAPTALLNISTVGDMNVPVNTGIAFSRAAGAIPFLRSTSIAAPDYPDYVAPPDLVKMFGKTPNQVLIDSHVVEGIARLSRHPAGGRCARNLDPTVDGCKGSTKYEGNVCRDALLDPESLSEGRLPYDQQQLPVPLRLARVAAPTTQADLQSTWAPRLRPTWEGKSPLGATLQPYLVPEGVHGFDPPDPCKVWDGGAYLLNTLAHFFATSGRDLYYLSHPKTHAACAAATDPAKGCDWGS